MAATSQQSTPTQPDPAAIVPPPLRSDLGSTPRRYLGRDYVIYKNPISLAFFRLPAAHAEAAREFDGKTNLATVAQKLGGSSRYWRALAEDRALEELAALAVQLSQAGLLQVRAAGATERGRRLRELKSRRAFEMLVAQAMFFRKSLYDPDRLLTLILPWVDWVYRRGVLLFLAGFVAVTLLAALSCTRCPSPLREDSGPGCGLASPPATGRGSRR